MSVVLSEIQEDMINQPVIEVFSETGKDSLRCIIRLVVEFYNYLQSYDISSETLNSQFFNIARLLLDQEGLRYRADSVLSGIISFVEVNSTYKVLNGAKKSDIEWNEVSPSSLAALYIPKFHEFIQTSTFENKCRLLLDLFQIQIVFAGMVYV